MIKKYRLVFLGLREKEERFKISMSQLGVLPETVEELISRAPIAIKRDVTLGEARRYADAIQEAGGRVTIQEQGKIEESRRNNPPTSIIPLQDFTMCPECGFKQPKGQICVKCGFRFTKNGKARLQENV